MVKLNYLQVLSHFLLQGDDLHAEVVVYDTHSMPKEFQQILPQFEN